MYVCQLVIDVVPLIKVFHTGKPIMILNSTFKQPSPLHCFMVIKYFHFCSLVVCYICCYFDCLLVICFFSICFALFIWLLSSSPAVAPGPPEMVTVDSCVVREGEMSLRIQWTPPSFTFGRLTSCALRLLGMGMNLLEEVQVGD